MTEAYEYLADFSALTCAESCSSGRVDISWLKSIIETQPYTNVIVAHASVLSTTWASCLSAGYDDVAKDTEERLVGGLQQSDVSDQAKNQ